jgi:hypothetical protein
MATVVRSRTQPLEYMPGLMGCDACGLPWRPRRRPEEFDTGRAPRGLSTTPSKAHPFQNPQVNFAPLDQLLDSPCLSTPALPQSPNDACLRHVP